MASSILIPSVNVIVLIHSTDAMNMMADYGLTLYLNCHYKYVNEIRHGGDVQKALEERNIFSVIYDGTQPNP
ncbi:hypothetical protein ACLK1T_13270 [Escherichia coli]